MHFTGSSDRSSVPVAATEVQVRQRRSFVRKYSSRIVIANATVLIMPCANGLCPSAALFTRAAALKQEPPHQRSPPSCPPVSPVGAVAAPPSPPPPLRACTKCKLRSYCSVDCQREHWEGDHKTQCAQLRKAMKLPQEPEMLCGPDKHVMYNQWERGTRGQGGLLVWGGEAGICQRVGDRGRQRVPFPQTGLSTVILTT